MKGMSTPGILSLVLAVLSALVFPCPSAVSAEASAAAGTQIAVFSMNMGPLWYLRSTGGYDGVTMIEGGAEGSAVIFLQDSVARTTDWFFVEGNKLYFIKPDSPTKIYSSANVGDKVTTTYPSTIGSPSEANQKRLTGYLVDLYRETKGTGQQVLHVPFLVGSGWDSLEATKEDAVYVLGLLDLTVRTQGEATGRVYKQSPAAGTILNRGDSVTIYIHTDSSTPPPTVNGSVRGQDTPEAASTVTLSAAALSKIFLDIGAAHTSARDITGQCATTGVKDNFWKLTLANPSGPQTVRIQRAGPVYSEIVLAAWRRDPTGGWAQLASGCGLSPTLEFAFPSSGDCFLQAEFKESPFGEADMEIRLQ